MGFAEALAEYCFAHPEDDRATHYMQRVETMGDEALREMVAAGEIPLANKVLAERKMRSTGT